MKGSDSRKNHSSGRSSVKPIIVRSTGDMLDGMYTRTPRFYKTWSTRLRRNIFRRREMTGRRAIVGRRAGGTMIREIDVGRMFGPKSKIPVICVYPSPLR
jgi:hypothetical protein